MEKYWSNWSISALFAIPLIFFFEIVGAPIMIFTLLPAVVVPAVMLNGENSAKRKVIVGIVFLIEGFLMGGMYSYLGFTPDLATSALVVCAISSIQIAVPFVTLIAISSIEMTC